MNKHKFTVVLLCDQIQRELPALRLLQKQLTKDNFSISIIGSLAEVNRMYFLLYKIKPDIIFISQIQEKVTRDIVQYVKKSGGIVCVLPMELSYSRTNLFWLFNNRLDYNKFVDYYFLPGEQFRNDLLEFTDIDKRKMFIVGSPKMDLLIKNNKQDFLSRKEFCYKYKIPINKKNIFIFTTFVASKIDYIKNEEAFKGNVEATLRIYNGIKETKEIFLRDIKKICIDFPDCNIILKPHPLEGAKDYLTINYSNFFIIQNELFNNTIESIDLAVHWNSTVATECWIQGKKTIQYSPIRKYNDLLSEFNKGNPVYEKYDELYQGLRKYLINNMEIKYLDFEKRYLKLWYFQIDGKSAKRISDILIKTLKYNQRKQYLKNYSLNFILFYYGEIILGSTFARLMIRFFKKNYQQKYADENYVFEE